MKVTLDKHAGYSGMPIWGLLLFGLLAPISVQAATVPTVKLPKKTITVFSADVSPVLVAKNDGESAQFQDRILPSKVTATAWSWDFSVPTGAGNSPACVFAPTNAQSTTIANSRWYANPNNACTAAVSADYTIKSKVTILGKQYDAETGILQVSVPWSPAGTTSIPTLNGYPDVNSRLVNGVLEWYVSGQGTLSRSTPQVVIYIPQSSQFYSKALAHENKHVDDLTSGIGANLWTVAEFYPQVQGLVSPTLGGLQLLIANAWSAYDANETAEVQALRSQLEKSAYVISDPIAPQFIYQNCGTY